MYNIARRNFTEAT